MTARAKSAEALPGFYEKYRSVTDTFPIES